MAGLPLPRHTLSALWGLQRVRESPCCLKTPFQLAERRRRGDEPGVRPLGFRSCQKSFTSQTASGSQPLRPLHLKRDRAGLIWPCRALTRLLARLPHEPGRTRTGVSDSSLSLELALSLASSVVTPHEVLILRRQVKPLTEQELCLHNRWRSRTPPAWAQGPHLLSVHRWDKWEELAVGCPSPKSSPQQAGPRDLIPALPPSLINQSLAETPSGTGATRATRC